MTLKDKLIEIGFDITTSLKVHYGYLIKDDCKVVINAYENKIKYISIIYLNRIFDYKSKYIDIFNDLIEEEGIELGIQHILNLRVFPDINNLKDALEFFIHFDV